MTELKPKRNAVRLLFSIEDAARIPGLESALTRDLRMALTEGVDRAIFLGDATARTGNDADIVGLNSATGITEEELTQAEKLLWPETVLGVHAEHDRRLAREHSGRSSDRFQRGRIAAVALDDREHQPERIGRADS